MMNYISSKKNDLNAIKVIKNIKNIKKVKVKEQSQKHYKRSMYYARVMMKLIQYFLWITSRCIKIRGLLPGLK